MDTPDAQGIRLDMTDTANEVDREYLDARLKEYNNTRSEYFRESRLPGQGAQPLDIYLRDSAGQIKGGLVAFTIWGWLYLDVLWLDESLRKHGYGTRLVQAAEAEARRRGVPTRICARSASRRAASTRNAATRRSARWRATRPARLFTGCARTSRSHKQPAARLDPVILSAKD